MIQVTLRRRAALGSAMLVLLAVACGGGSGRSGFAEDDLAGDPAQSQDPTEGTSGSFGGGGPQTGVRLEPKNTTIVIDTATNPATPAQLTYKALFKDSGVDKDVTAGSSFTLRDAAFGSFAGATFTSVAKLPGTALGVSTIVEARTPNGNALGSLTIVQLRKTGAQRDFFFVVPYNEPPTPQSDVLTFSTNIKQVDVAFAMDTTASMSGAINNLKSALSGTLMSQLQAAIPNVGLSVVDYKDYPVGDYGSGSDFPVKVRQVITTNLSQAQSAVSGYAASGGNDGPESQIPAMQHILTGEALTWSGGSVPKHTPEAGMWGGVDFRPGSVPVIVNITDINWHGENNTPYNFTTPTMASLKAAFAAKNAFFVNVTSGSEAQADELSDATNSNLPHAAFAGMAGCAAGQCCTNTNGAGRAPTGPGGRCRLNFKHSNGSGVSTAVAKAIEAIAVGSTFDVKAIPSNDPANAKGVDATKFIKALRAKDEGDAANGCPAHPAKDSDGDGVKDTFLAVKVGTPVCFEVIPQTNTTVPPEQIAQFYNAFVDVIGVQGNVKLDRRTVLFLVPPTDPGVK